MINGCRASYDSPHIDVVHAITWDSISPALPDKKYIGIVDVLDIAEHGVRVFLEDPLRSLKPRDSWPHSP